MKIGYFILNEGLREDPSVTGLLSDLEAASCEVYEIRSKSDVLPETDLVLSMGGDGTFLSAAHIVSDIGIPILGVNYGRIGFLCENRPDEVLKALMEGDFTIEYRTVLNATLKGPNARRNIGMLPYSVNEVAIHRKGPSVLGIRVTVNGETLPTYWADGLIVSTCSGHHADRPAQPERAAARPARNRQGGHRLREPGRDGDPVHRQPDDGNRPGLVHPRGDGTIFA